MITPCSKCHKRHGRDHSPSISKPSTRQNRAFLLLASLLAGAVAASHPVDVSPLAGDAVGLKGSQVAAQKKTGLFAIYGLEGERGVRRIQTEEEEHDHDHGDEEVVTEEEHDHDHADEGVVTEEEHDHDHSEEGTSVTEAEEHDHDHDHEEEGTSVNEEEHDDHSGHDHGDEDHDDHSGHDHGDDEHDDHSGHDHEYETDSITNEQATSSEKPWGIVIGATLLVNCATLSGLLLLLLPAFRKGMLTKPGEDSSHTRLMDIMIPSFAVGALIATAVFLVMPEALAHIGGGHAHGGEGEDEHAGHDHRFLQDEHNHEDNTEGQNAAKFGCGVLGGFLLPILLSIIFHVDEEAEIMGRGRSSLASDEDECQSCKDGGMPQDKQGIATGVIVSSINSAPEYDADASMGESEKFEDTPIVNDFEQADPGAPETKTKTFINYRLGASILIGDAFHNFADGLFIGAAFLGCSYATAISIVLVTMFHEMAQEIADFVLLTRYVGLTVPKACLLNFTSGLSVCLGGITVLAAKPSDEAIGVILAIAAGVYLNVAAVESLPRVEKATKNRTDRAITLASIIVGTIPIGLILLDHKHC